MLLAAACGGVRRQLLPDRLQVQGESEQRQWVLGRC
jgi:hypothetical protein